MTTAEHVELEPVAWRVRFRGFEMWNFTDEKYFADLIAREGEQVEPLYTAPPSQPTYRAAADRLAASVGCLLAWVSPIAGDNWDPIAARDETATEAECRAALAEYAALTSINAVVREGGA